MYIHVVKKMCKRTMSLLLISSLAILMAGCIDDIKPNVTNYFMTVFNQDKILYEGIHVFHTSASVSGATLTIMPGAILKFKEDASLIIGGEGDAAAIIAHGTIDNPILFTADSDSPTAGFWDRLSIKGGSTLASSLQYCEFEYGGVMEYTDGANIYVGEVDFYMENCIVRYSEAAGVILAGNNSDIILDNNTFTMCGLSAITSTPNMAGSIGINNNFDSDGRILISAFDNLDVPQVTWKNLSIPYRLEQSLTVSSETGSQLTIDAGVEIQIKEDFRIDVGSSTGTGRIVAKGTEQNPIVFTSAEEVKVEGSWNGININNASDLNSVFKYCTFEYGGFAGIEQTSDPKGVIHVRSNALVVENCIFKNYRSPAIYLDEVGYFESFVNNSLDAPEQVGLYMHPNGVHTIGEGNVFNVASGVVIYKGTMSNTNVTWRKLDCTYIISGDMKIGSLDVNSSEGSTLTIAPGNTIELTGGVTIYIGGSYVGSGSLIADGTIEQIIFKKSGNNNWNSVIFQKALPGAILNNCIVEYGGSKQYDGAVHISYNDNVTITNNVIRYSNYYGLSHQGSNPVISGNQLIDNAYDGILITQ